MPPRFAPTIRGKLFYDCEVGKFFGLWFGYAPRRNNGFADDADDAEKRGWVA